MKSLILVAIAALVSACGDVAVNVTDPTSKDKDDASKTSGEDDDQEPDKRDPLKVTLADFRFDARTMTWQEAANNIPDGYALPTRGQLLAAIDGGTFGDRIGTYWSDIEVNDPAAHAWVVQTDSATAPQPKNSAMAVVYIRKDQDSSGQVWDASDWQFEGQEAISWTGAPNEAPEGYRLPARAELVQAFDDGTLAGIDGQWWSATEAGDSESWLFDADSGGVGRSDKGRKAKAIYLSDTP